MKRELRFAGSGGQGIILASIILAEACYADGMQVAQTQAYGPEARGSACKAELIISDEEIACKMALMPDFLLALTEEAFEKYSHDLSPDALILTDESICPGRCGSGQTLLRLPIISVCRSQLGTLLPLNIVALGAVVGLLRLSSRESLKKSVLTHVPRNSAALNLKALELGLGL